VAITGTAPLIPASDSRRPLESRIAQQGLSDVVRLYYGIDQGDHHALDRIMTENFLDGEIDSVIDDCSHLYGPTRASLNLLLPRVRPLGLYVIEDWGWRTGRGRNGKGPMRSSGMNRRRSPTWYLGW
jgi:hypothetical protein